jgi:hypothetical protein
MREGVEKDPLFLNKHPDPCSWKADLTACAAKKAEIIDFAFAENKPQSSSVFACKCPAHSCAVVQKTLHKVRITHLEAVSERRASPDIGLVDADVHLRVDKRLHEQHVRVPQSMENGSQAPREIADGGNTKFYCPGEVRNPQTQRPHEQDLLARTMQ